MGINNRQRRAAKAKERGKKRSRSRAATDEFTAWAQSPEFIVGAASLALRELVLRRLDGDLLPHHHERFSRYEVEYQQLAVDDLVAGSVRSLISRGWTPRDLSEIARRRLTERQAAHLLATVAAETAAHDATRVPPAWRAQVNDVRPSGGSRKWAQQHRLAWDDAREDLIGLLCAVATLPPVEKVMPRPGERRTTLGEPGIVDERILGKVRGLLAKAESTGFEEEAEALTAKAQELMTTYAIERALAETAGRVRTRPVVRRFWLDAPYVDGKAMLVNQVADNNRSRCILTRECGFVTLVGFAADLDAVEVLSTSLLLQASRAMRTSGAHRTRWGTSSTRSFRQSFLLAYAQRIGERLRGAAEGSQSQADIESDGSLLPVLAARDDAVTQLTAELFPELDSRSVGASNAAGLAAGRSAADLALFDIRKAIERAG